MKKAVHAWFPAWANCTWMCCWSACGANTGIGPRAGNPQVVLRESVRAAADADVTFDRELGKERHQGRWPCTWPPARAARATV